MYLNHQREREAKSAFPWLRTIVHGSTPATRSTDPSRSLDVRDQRASSLTSVLYQARSPGRPGENVVARLVKRFVNEYNANDVGQGKESFKVCNRGHSANLAFSDSGEICAKGSQKGCSEESIGNPCLLSVIPLGVSCGNAYLQGVKIVLTPRDFPLASAAESEDALLSEALVFYSPAPDQRCAASGLGYQR